MKRRRESLHRNAGALQRHARRDHVPAPVLVAGRRVRSPLTTPTPSFCFLLSSLDWSDTQRHTKSMSLKYEPALEPLHMYVK